AAQRLLGDAAPIDHLEELAAGTRLLRAEDGGGDRDLAEAMGEEGGRTACVLRGEHLQISGLERFRYGGFRPGPCACKTLRCVYIYGQAGRMRLAEFAYATYHFGMAEMSDCPDLAKRGPGRPRSDATRCAILKAAYELLAEGGMAGFTIEG